jgi:hypothetical protein
LRELYRRAIGKLAESNRSSEPGEKCYCSFSLIEFDHDKSHFAVTLQSMLSERFALDRKLAAEIVESAKLLPPEG